MSTLINSVGLWIEPNLLEINLDVPRCPLLFCCQKASMKTEKIFLQQPCLMLPEQSRKAASSTMSACNSAISVCSFSLQISSSFVPTSLISSLTFPISLTWLVSLSSAVNGAAEPERRAPIPSLHLHHRSPHTLLCPTDLNWSLHRQGSMTLLIVHLVFLHFQFIRTLLIGHRWLFC